MKKQISVVLFCCWLLTGTTADSAVPGDPVECGELVTFENQAVYLRDLYVDPSGSDRSGTGTAQEPFATLQLAAQTAQPGEVIHVGAGNYPERSYLTNLQGTAEHPIKIIGPQSREALFSSSTEAIHLSDARYLIMEQLIFDGAELNGINIDDGGSYTTPSECIVLRGLVVRNIGSGGNNDGIKLSGVDNFYLLDSSLYGGEMAGAAVSTWWAAMTGSS